MCGIKGWEALGFGSLGCDVGGVNMHELMVLGLIVSMRIWYGNDHV